jgi:hypothetical protein
VRLYHVTDAAAAEAIECNGFRDGEGDFGMAATWPLGVLVSDEPLSVYEGARGNEVVEVVVPDSMPVEAQFWTNEGLPPVVRISARAERVAAEASRRDRCGVP